DAAKKYHASTMMYYDFNQRKDNTNIKVGNIVTLSGGIGTSFLKGAAKLGVAYGAQWKVAHDNGASIPPFIALTNGRVFGVGPEVGLPVFAKGQYVGLFSVRYLWPAGAKTSPSGQTLTATLTFARLIKQ